MLQTLLLLLDFALAAAVTWLLNWLALARYRRFRVAHWTERARRIWPARVAAASFPWLIPADIVLGQRLLGLHSLPPWPLAALAAWCGTILATYPFDRNIFHWLSFAVWRHQVLATWTIRSGFWLFFGGVVVWMPRQFDGRAWSVCIVFILGFAIWLAGGLVLACRALRLLTPAPDRLRTIVTDVAERMKMATPRVWLWKSSAASAAALIHTRELLFSERLLQLHPDDELAAICAHELGHLRESRLMKVGRLSGFMFLLPLIFIKPAFFTWGALGLVGLMMLSLLFRTASRRLSRRLETRADAIAHSNEADPGAFARALCRLHEENLIPAVMPRRRTHPDLYDRLLAAGVRPEYPRPAKPSSLAPPAMVFSILLGFLVVANFEPTVKSRRYAPLDDDPASTNEVETNSARESAP